MNAENIELLEFYYVDERTSIHTFSVIFNNSDCATLDSQLCTTENVFKYSPHEKTPDFSGARFTPMLNVVH